MDRKSDTKKLVVISMMCAIAYLCTFLFKFNVAFLTLDFKDAFIAITSLIYGPLYGVSVSVVVAFLEFITFSSTGIYGFIMNALASSAFAFTCGMIYKSKRTFNGAIVAVSLSALTMTAVMLLANMFITPLFMHTSRDEVIALIPKLLLPFNACKAVLNGAITMLLYKPVVSAMRRMGLMSKARKKTEISLKSIVLWISTVVIIVLSILFLVLYLNGTFEILNN